MNPWFTVASSLISVIVGILLTLFVQRRTEIRRQKIEILRELSGYRFTLIEGGKRAQPADKAKFVSALNQVFVIYADDQTVIKALQDFQTGAVSKMGSTIVNDKLVSLFKAMARSASVDIAHFNDSFFLTPFEHS